MQTDLTISAKNGDSKVTNKISYVNPNASNDKLLLLAQKLNALTSNTYQNTTRTDKINLDTESQHTRTLTTFQILLGSTWTDIGETGVINMTTDQVPKLDNKTTIQIKVVTDNDVLPIVANLQSETSTPFMWRYSAWYGQINTDATCRNQYRVVLSTGSGQAANSVGTHSFTLLFPETDTYYALEIPLTIILTEEES